MKPFVPRICITAKATVFLDVWLISLELFLLMPSDWQQVFKWYQVNMEFFFRLSSEVLFIPCWSWFMQLVSSPFGLWNEKEYYGIWNEKEYYGINSSTISSRNYFYNR